MYEKHESYGVLKLSKQALQKGNSLNYGPLYLKSSETRVRKGSEQFETISN